MTNKCEETHHMENGVAKTAENGVSTKGDCPMLQQPEKGDCPATSPPDGGARAWVVMIASFLCNGILFGVINTYSVIYVDLQKKLEDAGVQEASSKASLVGSLAIGATFFLSPIAGILTDKIGIRMTTFIGGALASGGMLLSSFCNHSVEGLYLSYGVLFGMGASLAYTPSLVILGHYFKRYLGLVNGFVTAGSSIFTFIMPYLLDSLLKSTSLETCLRVVAALMALIMPCALLFKPLMPPPTEAKIPRHKVGLYRSFRSLINVDIWKKKKYVIWALAVPSALFGYFVPYVHMVKFVEDEFPESDGKVLVMCIGVTSGIGRLIFGKIADIPKIDRILLQQVSFLSIGILTMLIVATNNFYTLMGIALLMGLFDGCFISLLGPIAFEICGQKGATQAIGFLLGLCSIPLTVGPPIAGMIYDHTKSYYEPFLLAGVPPIIGAIALFLVRCVREDSKNLEVAIPLDVTCQPLTNGDCSKLPNCCDVTSDEDPNSITHDRKVDMKREETIVEQESDAIEEKEESESLLDAINKVTIDKLG